jgi:hypothetical protein
MMYFKILDENGGLVNTIVADLEYVEEHYPGRFEQLPDPPAADPAALPFPDLTRRQLLLGLLSIDITESMVDAQIDLIADAEERAYSRIEWKAASTFNRHHPLVDGLAIAFALPSEQVDTLWRWAASL